jgi:hypothetical protein
MQKIHDLSKQQLTIIAVAIGFLLGLMSFIGYRAATLKSDAVHYHADFAVYLNGKQDEFKSFAYYEEIEGCDVHDPNDAHGRAHMHNQVNHVVHAHANGVTWAHFFANLDYTLGDEVFSNHKEMFVHGEDGNKLTFYLNGEKVDHIANRVIGNEDVLLINYGNDNDEVMKQRYDSIKRGAHEANESGDPGACGAAAKLTFWNRIKEVLGLSEGPQIPKHGGEAPDSH